MRIDRYPGLIRRATPADAPALSQLMARLGTDSLPLAATDLAAHLERGHVLVLELEHGMLGAVAHVALDDTDGACHAFRYVAVLPSLARNAVEHRMTAAMQDLCDAARDEPPLPMQLAVLRREVARRLSHLMMLVLTIPHVIGSGGTNDTAVAMFVWAALALISASRTTHLPRAIARLPRVAERRPRGHRLRAWTDAVVLRLGELPPGLCGDPAINLAATWRSANEAPPVTQP